MKIIAHEIIRMNLLYLMFKFGIKTQSELATVLGVSESQITHVMRGDQEPSTYLLCKIREKFGCSIDDFLTLDLEKLEDLSPDIPETAYKCLSGVYRMYYGSNGYFNTLEDDSKLKNGILFVWRTAGSQNGCKVVALMDIKRGHADSCLEEVKRYVSEGGYENAWNYLMSINSVNERYKGKLTLSETQIYINLQKEGKGDLTQLVFHRPEEDILRKGYVGGLGTMSSGVEKGKDAHVSPSIRYVGLSNVNLEYESADIAKHLLFQFDGMDMDMMYSSVNEIFDTYDKEMFKESVYTHNQRRMMACISLQNMVNEMVKRSMCVAGEVTKVDDVVWCHYVESEKMHVAECLGRK